MLIPIPGAEEEFTSLNPSYFLNSQSIDVVDALQVPCVQSSDVLAQVEQYPRQSVIVSGDEDTIGFQAGELGVFTETIITQSALEIVSGESLLILADIIDNSINQESLAQQASVEIVPKLLVDGVEIPITRCEYVEPTGKLGAILNVTLAKKGITQIPVNADIVFSLIVYGSSGPVEIVLMEDGKLSGRNYSISYQGGQGLASGPTDEVTFGAIDIVGDKFTLTPKRPVTMFDPNKVKYEDVDISPVDSIIDEQGKPIMPIIEPITGLTMKRVLQRAFTGIGGYGLTSPLTSGQISTMQRVAALISNASNDQVGLGFSQVITNIEDYPASRADFTIEGGWNEGTRPFIDMFDPLVFVQNNIIYIIDSEANLPFGYTPKMISIDDYKRLSYDTPVTPNINSILVTYQTKSNSDEGLGRRTITNYLPPEGNGDTETRVIETITEVFELHNPTNVVDTFLERVVTEVRRFMNGGELLSNLIHRETIDNFYEDDLKTGHRRVVEVPIPYLGGPFIFLRTALTETSSIYWRDDPANPGQKVQARTHTRTEGAVYQTFETVEYFNPITNAIENRQMAFPYFPALNSNIIKSEEGIIGSGIISLGVLMETEDRILRRVRGNQYDVQVIKVNHLTGQSQSSRTTPTNGSAKTDPYSNRSRTMLIVDSESQEEIGPRIPFSINTNELPKLRAESLARRILERLKNPLVPISMDLPYVDFSIQKGSIVKSVLRENNTVIGDYIITGRSIIVDNIGKRGHRAFMSLETKQLP